MVLPFLIFINKYKKFKISVIHIDRLGHLALDTQLFFIKHEVRSIQDVSYFLIAPHVRNKRVINGELLSMFKSFSKGVDGVIMACTTPLFILVNCMEKALKDNNLLYEMKMESNESEFSLGLKTISFDSFQYLYGMKILRKMNIPKSNKIVSIFARDSSYLKNKSPQEDWSYHDYRDCDVNTYIDSIKYLINKGYTVVRVGSEFSDKLKFSDKNYIEYCLSEFKSEFMDLFLISVSDFVVGTTSGATDLAILFDIPFLGVNYAPFMESPLGKNDLFIQKKIVNQHHKVVPYKDIIHNTKYHLFDGNRMRIEHNMHCIDNTPNEIYNAVIEMTLRMEHKFTLSAKQKVLLNNYYKNFCSRNVWSNKSAPISIKWLENNKELYFN